jgi:hypothetical protein
VVTCIKNELEHRETAAGDFLLFSYGRHCGSAPYWQTESQDLHTYRVLGRRSFVTTAVELYCGWTWLLCGRICKLHCYPNK